jgi:hypothetical protein
MGKTKKKADAGTRSRERQLAEELLVEQQRTAEALRSLSAVVGALQSSSGDQLLAEIRTLLDDVLVAQHRTNHLLELALRAGFDDDERARAR